MEIFPKKFANEYDSMSLFKDFQILREIFPVFKMTSFTPDSVLCSFDVSNNVNKFGNDMSHDRTAL